MRKHTPVCSLQLFLGLLSEVLQTPAGRCCSRQGPCLLVPYRKGPLMQWKYRKKGSIGVGKVICPLCSVRDRNVQLT